ncbi:MAG: hypothetical protein CMB53_02675 [Euryarchaeota archaeon]|nr:hypothetical protein [Euryarchaeota archaeon]|tara:strand:+ start:25553 stop:25942 length:390 start_codon:yes stop_codon:yes gene_type:complete
MARQKRSEPKWIEVPEFDSPGGLIEPGQDYHDLGKRYPDAPVPRAPDDALVHRADLDDLTGIGSLMNWVSEGDIVIVKMSNILNRELELRVAVDKIQRFVEGDLSGEVVRLGERRLLLLPPTFASGIES